MSIFLDLGNVSTQLNAATAATLNNVLTAFESLSFFNKGISAQNVCTNLEYEMYPLLVKYQLEGARNAYNAPSMEFISEFAGEVSALELYDTSIHSKITTSKTTYDTLYTAQFANIGTLNTNLVKQNQKSLVDLNTFQKSITSTLNVSNQALTLRQSITNRLITDLTPVNVPISKARLNTFIERNTNTLLHLATAVSGINTEIEGAKLLINNTFSTLNTTYKTLSSSLKAENTTITTNVNSYTRNAINTAVRLRFTGIGNGTNGVLGYRYSSGKLSNTNVTISGVTFVFRKGLATRNNELCNGWLGGVYYVDGFSTTLPSTGTGRWNNWDYVNGIKLQGSFSTGYYNRIPGVSSVEVMPPWVIQCAKDNNKWYNYYPAWPVSDIIEHNKQSFTYNQPNDSGITIYRLPHYTSRLSDVFRLGVADLHSDNYSFIRLPFDNDLNLDSGSWVGIESMPRSNGVIAHLDLLLNADTKLNFLRGATLYCQETLASILTAVSSDADNAHIQDLYLNFNYGRAAIVDALNVDGVGASESIKPIFFHRKFSRYTFVESSTSNIYGYNVPWAPINMSSMFEFEILCGGGHNSDFSSPIIDVYNTYEFGIENVSRTLSEIVSGDTFSDGSNVGLTPVLARINDTYIPSLTASLASKYTTLCRAYSSTAPVYATGYVFLSGGKDADLIVNAIQGGVPDNILGFSPYLSSWTAFQVDENGVAQPFTGTYTTIAYSNTSIDLNFVAGAWTW